MKKIFALVATASLLFSCSQEVAPEFEKLPINISVGQQTRANDSTFENEDEVGIYVVNYDGSTAGTLAASGNQVDNERFTYNNGAWTPDKTIYWKDQSTAADFYAYYPYSESVNISAHPFFVMADQSTEDNFWASDFLWGKATKVTPTSTAVPVVTNHSLSRIIVNVKPGNGFTEESWAAAAKSVKVCDVMTSATIDLSTGTATATGDKGEIIPLSTDGVYKAMLVPQEVADNSKLVVVTVDGVDYVYRKGYTFKRNTQHTFTITVNKKGGNVDVTIGEWDMDDFVNIGNAEEEDATIPNNQIWYTSTDETIVEPYDTDAFSANIVSNTYENGRGIITFDGDVTSIGRYAFDWCLTLTSIIIPESVTSIGGAAFRSCDALTSMTIPDGVTSISHMAFSGCSNLTSMIIPEGVSRIEDGAFAGCSSLTSITIPKKVSNIGDTAFSYCSSLTSITIPEGVTSIGDSVFEGCSSLTAIYGKNASADNRCWIEDGVLKAFAPSGLKIYTIPEGVSSINTWTFAGCSSLTNITIPKGVTNIKMGAFTDCSSLTSITIPEGLTSIGERVFQNCTRLTSIIIPEGIIEIEPWLFYNCTSLTSITLPEEVKSICDEAFSGCTSLTTIDIPNSVTFIGPSAFRYCSSLTSITIPDKVTSIGVMAFRDCTSLSEVYCMSTTPPTTYSGTFTFANNASDRKLYVPRNSVDAYKSATGWSDYADYIIGYDF